MGRRKRGLSLPQVLYNVEVADVKRAPGPPGPRGAERREESVRAEPVFDEKRRRKRRQSLSGPGYLKGGVGVEGAAGRAGRRSTGPSGLKERPHLVWRGLDGGWGRLAAPVAAQGNSPVNPAHSPSSAASAEATNSSVFTPCASA
jgi:hypothetical protein